MVSSMRHSAAMSGSSRSRKPRGKRGLTRNFCGSFMAARRTRPQKAVLHSGSKGVPQEKGRIALKIDAEIEESSAEQPGYSAGGVGTAGWPRTNDLRIHNPTPVGNLGLRRAT